MKQKVKAFTNSCYLEPKQAYRMMNIYAITAQTKTQRQIIGKQVWREMGEVSEAQSDSDMNEVICEISKVTR